MSLVRIGRGHWGPARIGSLKIDTNTYDLPALLVLSENHEENLYYEEISSSKANRFRILQLGSIATFNRAHLSETPSDSLILLPTILGLNSLNEEASKFISAEQQRIAENEIQESKRKLVFRSPPRITSSDFTEAVQSMKQLGVQAASFSFDGSLGPRDLRMIRMRTEIPQSWLALALGMIEPAFVPLFYYLGFDLIDTSFSEAAASYGIRLWSRGREKIDVSSNEPRLCYCPACFKKDLGEMGSSELYSTLNFHNRFVYLSVLSESVSGMRSGRLRWLVETMTHHSPSLASLLRLIDRRFYPYLEEFTPTTGTGGLPLIGPESYRAPAVRRFRERLERRYSPPNYKQLILLLPCSAKKPYSDSKSHRKFSQTISSALRGRESAVAEVILTSPIGVIPRELERIHPIANYDIPVTGDWDQEEMDIASDALAKHLSKFSESAVIIAHLSGGYLDILSNIEDKVQQSIIYTTKEDSTTSYDALTALHDVLVDMRESLPLMQGLKDELRETLQATADYQFGNGAGDLLIPEDSRLRGKLYRMVVCRVNHNQTCAYVSDTGALSLTLQGARLLQPLNRYWVRFDGTELRGSSVFAVGISDADRIIRPGDEVLVINKDGALVGVGRSEMSGNEMIDFDNGLAVSLRHKKGEIK